MKKVQNWIWVSLLFITAISQGIAWAGPTPAQIAQAKKEAEALWLRDFKAGLGIGPPTVQSELARQALGSPLTLQNGPLGKILPKELLKLLATYIAHPDERRVTVGQTIAQDPNVVGEVQSGLRKQSLDFKQELIQAWPGFAQFDREFGVIPQGFLPGQLPGELPLSSFEAAPYPVTRQLWNEIMGAMPTHVPRDQRATWNTCLTCPVTYVNWEEKDGSPAEVQAFLTQLNKRTERLGCTYDLPSDRQLHYLHRGDPSGINRDLYSAGVTSANVNEYVTHWGNSDTGAGQQIQPVGLKKPNAFGIELGNVWKMSKDSYNANPSYGRSVRGGSWYSDVDFAESGFRYYAYAGDRDDDMGFALVRTCH